jgi:alpha-mannosidase
LVQPTIFYKTRDSKLVELAEVSLRTTRSIPRTTVRVVVGSTEVKQEVSQTAFGDLVTTVEVPAPEAPLPVALYVAGARAPVYQGTFQPQRRWRVYANPREQADFGYNEIPALTLEWENRFTDRFLDIMKEFPSYSFTLDASANLESYLATRDEAHRKLLLDHLRSGKVGMNALWLNFFTGLATPEELFRMLEYAARAGKQYGFTVDEASQTDEPTATWAFPQILAEAGIKYYSNGSDPIRGPSNPLGHLNFQSPFYWEGPNGAKILMWSAVSYTVVHDMTWNGWNPVDARAGKWSPSLYGLQHSLPLFLSQYDRQDHPFDAVLLYGLENDEIPIVQNGNADVIERWNQEYAYPKIIAGTQRDYFTYITEHFGSQIQTHRGDGGAYWEDEAGADAKIAAMNRTSQMQVTAAEIFESVANWIKPLLQFDEAPFNTAWYNIMLADCYVWSDSTSFKRPYSYRVRVGEDAHRGWADAARQQTWDLLTVATDKISELIQTDKEGAVVFNVDSHPRSGLFDFELGHDQVLQDPATGQLIPCGMLKSFEEYQDVRCWAGDVPPLGYKFYTIAKGKVPSAEEVSLDDRNDFIDARYYKLQLDPQTGAVVHLVDKATGQDLANPGSGYGLNEYLYVTGGDPGQVQHGTEEVEDITNRILDADPTLPLPKLTINRQSVVGTPQVRRYPWGTTVTVHSRSVNTPEIMTTIFLNDEQKEVVFDNQVDKVSTLKKEGAYFAFPFAVQNPKVEYQGATAWVNPEVDMLPGAGREWFTTQGGVRVKGTNQTIGWVSVDAPLITLEDINRGLWPATVQIRNGAVFSYAMNNYWYTDTPAQQGGHFTFRYVLTSGADLPLTAMTHLSKGGRMPLHASRHYYKQWKQILPEKGAGFLTASPEGVEILTVRPTSEKNTYLVRVHNTTDQTVNATFHFPMNQLEDAYMGSILGDRVEAVKWSEAEAQIPLSRYGAKTLVVRVKPYQE